MSSIFDSTMIVLQGLLCFVFISIGAYVLARMVTRAILRTIAEYKEETNQKKGK